MQISASQRLAGAGGDEAGEDLPDQRQPFALVGSSAQGLRISALNARGLAEGLRIGMPLNDARAAMPALLTRPAEPERDRAALGRLALWCGRYGPARNVSGEDGLWIDTAGVAHLYGGEEALLADLTGRLGRLGIGARAGLADTFGAAFALARFATSPQRKSAIAESGGAKAAIAGLPVEALRLEPDTVVLLKRLGLRRIGQVSDLPRSALAARFREGAGSGRAARSVPGQAMAVLARLDQAEGRLAEPLRPMAEPPQRIVRANFAEPLLTAEGVAACVRRLAEALCEELQEASEGARRFTLGLYRADGTVASASAGTSRACRDPAHVLQLLAGRIEEVDAGFGIDVLTLSAARVERLDASQTVLVAGDPDHSMAALDRLADRLSNRLGAHCVTRIVEDRSHLPERAEQRVPALGLNVGAAAEAVSVGSPGLAPRPAFLLARPEPISVLAEVPEGAPQRFTWRRIARRVGKAQGPERIAPEWWREIGAAHSSLERDYYLIEDEEGGRYWVFRAGRYGQGEEDELPQWFVHGFCA